MSEQEILKIEIPVEEEPPLKVEESKSGAKTAAYETSRKIAELARGAAQRAAQSEAGRKAAGKFQEAADRSVRYVGTRMADSAEDQARQTMEAMQKRLKVTDWEKEGKEGLASGLQWLSSRLKDWSDRVTPDDNDQ